MKNQKGSVLVAVIITILSLAVAGLGGFVVYDKVIKEDNTVEEKTDNKSNTEKETTEEKEEINESDNISEKTNEIVDSFTYNVVTDKIHKFLIGKYVDIEDSQTYFEIKPNGEVDMSIHYCEGVGKYSTNDVDVRVLYYDWTNMAHIKEDTQVYIYITPKLGSKNEFYPFELSGEFDKDGNAAIKAGDYNFMSLRSLGCKNSNTRFKKQ